MIAATHSGKFHADDVLAWALLRLFHSEVFVLKRTRIADVIEKADIVFDVGGAYSSKNRRFDHHQHTYNGDLSSAGMMLEWLHKQDFIDEGLRNLLDSNIVRYVDNVDNGRIPPDPSIPCFANIVDSFNHGCHTLEEFDRAFEKASKFAEAYVEGLVRKQQQQLQAKKTILKAMRIAEENRTNVIELPRYLPWKPIYFSNGGEEHKTEYVIFPTLHGTWQAVAIPPVQESFAQKKPFPEAWAGLRDQELCDAIGFGGAIFCHKNRFVAVFQNKESLIAAMKKFNLV